MAAMIQLKGLDGPVLINADNVLQAFNNGDSTTIRLVNGDNVYVTETLQEITQLAFKASR